jgi:hypothetical protein
MTMKIKMTPKLLVSILYIAITLSCSISLVVANMSSGHGWSWGLPITTAALTGIPSVLFYFAGKEAGRNEVLNKKDIESHERYISPSHNP